MNARKLFVASRALSLAGQAAVSSAASQGFKLMTYTTSDDGNRIQALMERALRTATFHRELETAVDGGRNVVDTTYGRVPLERRK